MPAKVNEIGGIDAVVSSTVGRNIWTIMKMFKVLPNDPQLKALTFAQREFIAASIVQDGRDEKLGGDVQRQSHMVDNSDYKDKFYSNENIELLEDGDDLNDIYNQVKGLTNDPRFEQDIDNKIEHAIEDKENINKNVDQVIKESWDKIEKQANQVAESDIWDDLD